MTDLRVRLFGIPEIRCGVAPTRSLEGRKALELFCYLLLARGRRCPREALATLLWPEAPPERAKKYLRQATWRIHSALDPTARHAGRVLTAGPEWLQIADDAAVWCDVGAFEAAVKGAAGARAETLDSAQVLRLRQAVDLYRGDLLETWYQDWCLFERERLQNIYLVVLDKLCAFHEQRGEPEPAIVLALRILRTDPTREHIHRSLMRLYLRVGDRTAALRQFARCQAALSEELGVSPAAETVRLFNALRSDEAAGGAGSGGPELDGLAGTIAALRRLQPFLAELQRQVDGHLAALDRLASRAGTRP